MTDIDKLAKEAAEKSIEDLELSGLTIYPGSKAILFDRFVIALTEYGAGLEKRIAELIRNHIIDNYNTLLDAHVEMIVENKKLYKRIAELEGELEITKVALNNATNEEIEYRTSTDVEAEDGD